MNLRHFLAPARARRATDPAARRRRSSGAGRRSAGPLVLVAAIAAISASSPNDVVHAAACDSTWSGAGGDGLWFTAANWSPAIVPDASRNVCLDGTGSYTVSIVGSAPAVAASITVGGTAGTQVLRIGNGDVGPVNTNGYGSLTISGPSSVGTHGVLRLDQAYNNGNAVLTGSTVTNNGTITITGIHGSGYPYLRSNVVNNGVLAFQAVETIVESGVTITNNATTHVASGAAVRVRNGATFVNQSGTLTNNGTFNVHLSATAGAFTQGAATVTGNAPTIESATWNGTGNGAGSFTVLGTSKLTGGIAAAQTLRLDDTSGNAYVGIPSNFTNNGTLVMDMNYNNANTALRPSAGSATLTNNGTLRVQGIAQSSGRRSLQVNVVNNGTLAFNSPDSMIDAAVTVTNNATTTVAANASVFVVNGGTFANQAGTLTNNGAFNVNFMQSAGTFRQGGGSVTGHAPVIDAATWNGTGGGSGSFTVLGSSTLLGGIAAGQTLRLDDTHNNAAVGIPTSFTNAGTLVMDMNYNNANTILQPTAGTAMLTNTGTFKVMGLAQTSGTRSLRVNVANRGRFVIDANVVLDFTGTVTQQAGGMMEFDLASASRFGRMVGRDGGHVVLAGTADAVLVGGFAPAAGTPFDVITSPHTGNFSTVTNTFTSDVGNATVVRLVAGTGSVPPTPGVDALLPARLLDTRPGESTVDGGGQGAGLQGAGATIEMQVTGRAGVPADAAAAVLNVTVTEAQAPGFVTVWPCGTDRPNASNLNYVTGSTVPNGVIAKIGANGKVCLFVSAPTQLLVDVAGYFSPGAPYVPLLPARVLDSRGGTTTFDGQSQGAGPAAPGSITEVQITGRAGVPASASAVVLNVTVTEAQGAGFVTVYPCGSDRPNASNLNYVTGSTVPNNVIAKVGQGGKVCLFTSNATHLVADVNGYFKPSTAFQAIVPSRLTDTRQAATTIDGIAAGAGIAAPNSVTEVQITGRASVPAGATAAVLNVTVTEAQGAGFVTVWPCGTTRPLASSLNFVQGSTVPNGVIAKVGQGGKVCLYVSNGTHLIADVVGYFRS